MTHYVTSGGDKGSITIEGANKNADTGIVFAIPEGETAIVDVLTISHCFVGMITRPAVAPASGRGTVIINELRFSDIGGDVYNLRTSNVAINKLIGVITADDHTRPYGEYHQDIGQAYAVLDDGYTLDPDGVIENINIPYIDVVNDNPDSQLFALTENNRYANWNIGTTYFSAALAYFYALNANTIDNFTIGNDDPYVEGVSGMDVSVQGGVPFLVNNRKGATSPTAGNVMHGFVGADVNTDTPDGFTFDDGSTATESPVDAPEPTDTSQDCAGQSTEGDSVLLNGEPIYVTNTVYDINTGIGKVSAVDSSTGNFLVKFTNHYPDMEWSFAADGVGLTSKLMRVYWHMPVLYNPPKCYGYGARLQTLIAACVSALESCDKSS